MAGVDIGPFQNIVGVSWVSASIKVTVIDFGPSFRFLTFTQVDELGDPVVNDGTVYQGVLTGVTSGATVDLTNMPATGNDGAPIYVFPGCAFSNLGFYAVPSGAPLTGSGIPGLGGYIGNTVDAANTAVVWFVPSSKEDSGSPPSTCVLNVAGPSLPAFIDSEDVTVVKPPPEE